MIQQATLSIAKFGALAAGCLAGIAASEGCGHCPIVVLGDDVDLQMNGAYHSEDAGTTSLGDTGTKNGFRVRLVMDAETVVLTFEKDGKQATVSYARPPEATAYPEGF